VEVEERIDLLRRDKDFRGAATAAIESYGPELYGFLVGMLRNETDAREVFSQTCEDLWNGIERFEGQSSMRTWLYTLARHAAARLRRSPHRRAGLHVTASALSAVEERVRTATERYLRTDAKDRFQSLRDALDEDERSLLILRVDRGMAWVDIARVFSAPEATEDALDRESARLRKRFQSLKEKIRASARSAGFLDEDSEAPFSRLPGRSDETD
jgi:RNA polymerase sigma-70 factor (ECF subfamily)